MQVKIASAVVAKALNLPADRAMHFGMAAKGGFSEFVIDTFKPEDVRIFEEVIRRNKWTMSGKDLMALLEYYVPTPQMGQRDALTLSHLLNGIDPFLLRKLNAEQVRQLARLDLETETLSRLARIHGKSIILDARSAQQELSLLISWLDRRQRRATSRTPLRRSAIRDAIEDNRIHQARFDKLLETGVFEDAALITLLAHPAFELVEGPLKVLAAKEFDLTHWNKRIDEILALQNEFTSNRRLEQGKAANAMALAVFSRVGKSLDDEQVRIFIGKFRAYPLVVKTLLDNLPGKRLASFQKDQTTLNNWLNLLRSEGALESPDIEFTIAKVRYHRSLFRVLTNR